jgi:pSer/pThr/pTyr-binding forkhead associated (FHA) protein
MAELIIQTGKHQGKKIDLAGLDCIIGRHEGCKIRIASGDVSKQHCRLRHKDDGLYAMDLGSRNGTFINDVALSGETPLQPGDLLRVGPMTFLVSQTKSAPAAAVAASGKSKPAKEVAADDDLIAAWLSEGGDIEKSGNDTTIVIPSSGSKPAPAAKAGDGKPAAQASAETPLKSVRDRAQEIIRRWQKEHEKG